MQRDSTLIKKIRDIFNVISMQTKLGFECISKDRSKPAERLPKAITFLKTKNPQRGILIVEGSGVRNIYKGASIFKRVDKFFHHKIHHKQFTVLSEAILNVMILNIEPDRGHHRLSS